MVHEYDDLESLEVWNAVQNELPILIEEINKIFTEDQLL
jgi:uncharacterized protein with HEPN domain